MVLSEGLLFFCNGCGDEEVGGCKAIPPVVARIFSGDSTSPLTREASLVRGIVRKISLMVRIGSNPHRHGSE